VTDSLASLPDATLVTTTDGNVVLSNQPARAYFAGIGIPQVNDALVPYLFAKMSQPVNTDPVHSQSFSWWDLLDLKQTRLMAQGIEVRDPAGKDLLIKSAPCYDADKHLTGWIVSMVNITAIQQNAAVMKRCILFLTTCVGPRLPFLRYWKCKRIRKLRWTMMNS
jgi:hypothetical protein